MKILYILLFTWIGMHALGAQVYYVAPGGASQLSTNINAPGSLDFAAANAGPGDTVWVKAGNYGALNLEFQHSGTAGQPIAFIGYHQQPGDLDSTHVPQNINTYTGGNYASKFPTLDGGNRATAGLKMLALQPLYFTWIPPLCRDIRFRPNTTPSATVVSTTVRWVSPFFITCPQQEQVIPQILIKSSTAAS